MPHAELNILENRDILAVKNRMTDISANFPSGWEIEKLWCSEQENMEHIYTCKLLNKEQLEISYNQLYNRSIEKQIILYKRFRKILMKGKNRKIKMIAKIFPT